MNEKREQGRPLDTDYRRRVHDYFFSDPESQDKRNYYEHRGLTFTNNLHLWFQDDPEPELLSGVKNPHDYHQRNFGPVLEKFREEHGDLWREVQQAVAIRKGAITGYAELFKEGKPNRDEFEAFLSAQGDRSRELEQYADEVKSRAFAVLAPELIAAGIDPVDVCK